MVSKDSNEEKEADIQSRQWQLGTHGLGFVGGNAPGEPKVLMVLVFQFVSDSPLRIFFISLGSLVRAFGFAKVMPEQRAEMGGTSI